MKGRYKKPVRKMIRKKVIEKLQREEATFIEKKMVVGFDGFVDTTARPIYKVATEDSENEMFETISDFADFLKSKANKSCSVELKVEGKSIGGNLPLLSMAAATLGADVSCIGMLGETGSVEETFKPLPCKLYSFAPSGTSTCLEFNDGKILLAPTYELEANSWELVLKATNGQAAKMFSQADLVALVNWSELSFSQFLWNETYEKAFSHQSADKSKYIIFDLCDISRKGKREIEDVLELIGKFSTKRTGVLSLNENEALVIGASVYDGMSDAEEIAKNLRADYQIDEIVIHGVQFSLMLNSRGLVMKDTIFVEKPVKTTGAGDNYNGALSVGLLMGLEDEERVELAHLVANFYISRGYSPKRDELKPLGQ
jgi:sugar/nucleoside kinase (ribokinase family)